jgi:hypothetical protein
MTKLNKPFEFTYNLTEKNVKDGKQTKIHMGNITLKGMAYKHTSNPLLTTLTQDKYDFDIKSIQWNGQCILGLTPFIKDELICEVSSAALKHIITMFLQEELLEFEYQQQLEEQYLLNNQ